MATVSYTGVSIFSTKTFWLNTLAFVVAILSLTEVVQIIPPQFMGIYGAALAMANVGLRMLTVRPAVVMMPGETRPVEVQRLGPPPPPTLTN